MIVVAIIALLVVIALPSFFRAREKSQNAKLINGYRIAVDAFEMYATEHNAYPPDVNRGVVPAGMDLYFGSKLHWTQPTPIGGNWDWDYQQFGFTAGVSVVGANADPVRMAEIDAKIDDGNLSSGSFQNTAADRYTSIIEP
jgi:type II secretory pathway pseudopilin PulG